MAFESESESESESDSESESACLLYMMIVYSTAHVFEIEGLELSIMCMRLCAQGLSSCLWSVMCTCGLYSMQLLTFKIAHAALKSIDQCCLHLLENKAPVVLWSPPS